MMKKKIDCLFIGENQFWLEKSESFLRTTVGTDSEYYRGLNFEAVKHNGKLFSLPEMYNYLKDGSNKTSVDSIFSATIAYLGTYLHRRGFTFDYVNSFQDDKEELIKILKTCDIEVIAITTTYYLSVHPILEIVSFIKQYNTTSKIVVGGPFILDQVRTHDKDTLTLILDYIKADFYINNPQGEATLVNLINRIKSKSNEYKDINNLIYKVGYRYIKTPKVNEDNRLEENMVDWSLFKDRIGESVLVRTSISCPFACAYCVYPQNMGEYQTACVKAIERELDALAEIGTVKSVNFIDDTLNVPPERFKEILRMMIRNKYKFKWGGFFRCQYADREMVELMKESGCVMVYMGIESGNQQVLNNMNKVATLEKYRNGIKLLNEYGIANTAAILVGFPGETKETIEETLRFIEETKPTFITVHLWYFSKFTSIWESREKFNLKGSGYEWIHGTMDAKTAMNFVEHIVLTAKNSILIQKFNFDSPGAVNLMNQGMCIEDIKKFIVAFNKGVRKRLLDPTKTAEIDDTVLNEMKKLIPK